MDRWFEDHISESARRWISLLLAWVGGFSGAAIASQLGLGTGLAVLLGAFAGLLVLPLLVIALKLVLLALVLGIGIANAYAIGVATGVFG